MGFCKNLKAILISTILVSLELKMAKRPLGDSFFNFDANPCTFIPRHGIGQCKLEMDFM
ncbi:hypothetical protein ACOSP7_014754 [Xanthoceras sorbifolium]